MLSEVRAVVFDLDDTLCGYWDASKKALREAFAECGPYDIEPEELFQHWATAFRKFSPTLKQTGWYEGYLKSGTATRDEQMRLTLLEAGIDNPELASKISERYMQLRDENLTLFPESLRVLEDLKERGYRLALMTNGPADIQRQEIATLEIERFFDLILIEGELGIGKPHRTAFTNAEEFFKLRPEAILFVGNSYGHDIAPSIEYGWKTAWVRRESDVSPSSTKPESKPDGAAEPDLTITSLNDLLPYLDYLS